MSEGPLEVETALPHHILVVANETVVSRSLVELIEERAAHGDVVVTVLAPVNQPRQGYVVYYDTRRAAARRRLDKTLDLLHKAGVHANGVVVETDPVSALRDAIDQLQPDEVIVSTHTQQKSGWLRRNAVDQMRRVAGNLPFQHVVVDLAAEHGETNVLVVANQTVLGAPLLDKIRERAAKSPAAFLIISPQGDAEGSYDDAERRLLRAVTLLRSEGIEAHGQISHPDPYSAVMQTLEDERVDELIVSTFPDARSGWLRRNLLERLRDDTKLPLEHVEVDVPAGVVV
jgi:phosphopantetheine adenylyltransferase